MPFKKRRKNKNTKEKKAIATRLMVISLKMDDYIYKNKPISALDAQVHIEEIATYKLKCINDVRSLQVIEKLTLFMKSIIKQNTSNNDRIDNKSLPSTPVSVIPNCEYIAEDNTENICAVDIPVSNEKKNQVNTCIEAQNVIDIDSFSNLTINPVKENLNKDTFDQTILSVDANNQFREDNSMPIQNNNEVTSVAVVEFNKNLDDLVNINTILNNSGVGNNKEVNQIPNITNDKVENGEGKNVIALHDINDTMSKVNNSKDKIEMTTNKPKRKVKTKVVRPKNEIKAKVSNKDKKPQRKQTNSKKSVAKKNKSTIGPTKKKHSKCPNIENENLPDFDNEIIDISWIENMKYVRVVGKDENDLTLNNLQDTFWKDLTLPANWNFNDFDYTD